MPKAIKKKIPKKAADTEEEVKEKLSSLKEKIQERQRTVFTYSIVVLIVLAVVAGFFIFSYTNRKKATELADEAYRVYYARTTIQGANKTEQYNKALDLFRQSYSKKKSPYSLFYIAALYQDLGQYDEALKTLRDFIQRYSGDADFLPLAYQKMAAIQIKKGDLSGAKKTLDLLFTLKGDIFKDFALLEYGNILEKEGKAEEARKKYEELAAKFPASPFIDEVKSTLPGKKNE
jgi:predicted negative regulator of RcsB-dependent stress response